MISIETLGLLTRGLSKRAGMRPNSLHFSVLLAVSTATSAEARGQKTDQHLHPGMRFCPKHPEGTELWPPAQHRSPAPGGAVSLPKHLGFPEHLSMSNHSYAPAAGTTVFL